MTEIPIGMPKRPKLLVKAITLPSNRGILMQPSINKEEGLSFILRYNTYGGEL